MDTIDRNRYFFLVSYKGTHFSGWQRQINARTVQQTIEETLAKVLGLEQTTIIGCGRTDKGVHASYYVFHTDLSSIDVKDLSNRLHFALPPSIRIIEIIQVSQPLHARFDAIQRGYSYYFHLNENPFYQEKSVFVSSRPDIQKMKTLAKWFSEQSNFRYFCKSPDQHHTTTCDLQSIQFYADPSQQHVRIEFISNRFLRGMIRIITQFLLQHGQGMIDYDDVTQRIHQPYAELLLVDPLRLAPPHGLYLSKVKYKTAIFKTEYLPSPFEDQHWSTI